MSKIDLINKNINNIFFKNFKKKFGVIFEDILLKVEVF